MVLAWSVWSGAASAHTCTDCSATACTVDCSGTDAQIEADFRSAVAGMISTCGGAKTISFSSCAAGKVIKLAQTTSNVAACGIATNGICLNGNGMTIDGAGHVFEYVGSEDCCQDPCTPVGTRLFTIRGSGNKVQNLNLQYFPEGIHVESGTGHLMSSVSSSQICEDAISLDGGSVAISGGSFAGHTTPTGSHVCRQNGGGIAPNCGRDKALQLNAGSATVTSAVFTDVRAPMKVSGGNHTFENNTITGTGVFCEALEVGDVSPNSAPLSATFRSNSIDGCKYGIEGQGTGNDTTTIIAENNRITNALRSAFHIEGTATTLLRAQGNFMWNYGTSPAGNPTGAILIESSAAHVDFGAGDASGAIVVQPSRSQGFNSFCGTVGEPDINSTVTATTGAVNNCWGQENTSFPISIDTLGSSISPGLALSCLTAGFTRCAAVPPTATATNTPAGPLPTPTSTGTITQTPSATRTRTATSTTTITFTPSKTATRTNTATITSTPTITLTPTITRTSTITPTATQTGTVTQTGTATRTGTVTSTPTVTGTSTATWTATPTPTPMCALTPLPGCHLPSVEGGSSLKVYTRISKLKWQWKKGGTDSSEFGMPVSTDTYALCLYDDSASPALRLEAHAPAGPNWGSLSGKFRYRAASSRDPFPDGIYKILLASGVTPKAKIKLTAQGLNLHAPSPPYNGKITVQLRHANGAACWSASYSNPSRNSSDSGYVAKSDP